MYGCQEYEALTPVKQEPPIGWGHQQHQQHQQYKQHQQHHELQSRYVSLVIPSVLSELATHCHDNLTVVCADGDQVHTSALLVSFLSPWLGTLLKESQELGGDGDLCLVLPHVHADQARDVLGNLLCKKGQIDQAKWHEIFPSKSPDFGNFSEHLRNIFNYKEYETENLELTNYMQAKLELVKNEPEELEQLDVKPEKQIKRGRKKKSLDGGEGKISAYLLKKYGSEENYREFLKLKQTQNPEEKGKRKPGVFTPFLLRKYGSQEAWEEHRKQKRMAKNVKITPRIKLCSHCGEEFNITDTKSEGAYSRHMKIHTIEKFKCDCEPSWKTNREKNFHMKCVHMGHFGCEPCVRTFASEDVFKSHMELTHSGAKFFICAECGFETHTKGNLQIHTQLSHDKEIQTCNICGAQFEGTYRLKAHLKRTHNELKPCPYCGQFFKNINKHINTSHTADSEKKYQCKECGKGFIDITKLNGHMMNVHIRSRPYHCRYQCGVSYNDRGNRNGHERSKHGGLWNNETGESLEKHFGQEPSPASFAHNGQNDQHELKQHYE